jgi:DNA-binding transcriptional ArsR family regulator
MAERDPRALREFVEHFAATLADAGMPRMPARVFAALLCTDSARLTAAELSELLGVSPAAVSGAVRYLVQLNLAVRESEPGSRRDRYRLLDDVWYEAALSRDRMIPRWEGVAREGVAALGPDTPAGARMAETLAYFEFVQEEIPQVLKRWREVRSRLRAGG